MFKLPLTYMDFKGNQKTKDFYFNLNKGEIAEIHLSLPTGLDGFLDKMNEDPEIDTMITVFKMIILKAYGKRTSDNKFIKSKELSEEFAATDAYSELFLKFLDNEDDFVNKFLEGCINAPAGTIGKMIEENADAVQEAEDKLLNSF